MSSAHAQPTYHCMHTPRRMRPEGCMSNSGVCSVQHAGWLMSHVTINKQKTPRWEVQSKQKRLKSIDRGGIGSQVNGVGNKLGSVHSSCAIRSSGAHFRTSSFPPHDRTLLRPSVLCMFPPYIRRYFHTHAVESSPIEDRI